MDNPSSIETIFFAALNKGSPQDRAAYLDSACGEDSGLRQRIQKMLDAHTGSGSFLEHPAYIVGPIGSGRPADDLPGQMIGAYKLLEQIGQGGMGTVWMAEQREPVKRRVALKIIKLGMDTRQVISRFEAERQALAMMDHPNIAKVLDAGATETGRPYFVMEYIKGVPILEYCDTGKLDTRARLELFSQVCHAIQHAHQKGIIHRDIKPSNVLVTMHDGVPVARVIDFGIAKATGGELTAKTLFTAHRQMIGTPAYMSPEQAEMSGLDIDTRSDIYSLGVLLYELLTGTTPFAHEELMSKGFAEMMRIIREVEPHKPSTRLSSLGETGTRTAQQRHIGDVKKLGLALRGDLDWIVMRCLEKDRTRRYETASGLAADIRRHLNDETVTAGAPGAGYRLRKFVKRNRAQVIAGGIVAGALVLGMVGTSIGMAWALNEKSNATLAAKSEAAAKIEAQENEQKAVASAKVAEAAKEEEAKARKRAETISTFVTTALKASDAQNFGGAEEARGGAFDMTIAAAMENAVKDVDSGRFKDDPETEADLRDAIGTILMNNGKYDKAKTILEQALATRERVFTGDNPTVASSLNKLAALHYRQGRFAQAEPLFTRALAVWEKALGPDHPDVASCLFNLAELYQDHGRFAQAEPLFTRALAIDEKAFGPDHPEVATCLNSLALLSKDQGRYAQAEPLFTRALAIREKALGPYHPEVANVLNNLAELYRGQGQFAQAEPLYTRTLEIREKALGPDHRGVATCLNNLALLYQDQGQYSRAEPLYTRALAIYEKALGPDHPSTAGSLNNLANLFLSQRKYTEAEPLLTRALAMRRKALGPEHLDVAASLSNLARASQALGKTVEARQGFDKALAMLRRLSPEGSPVFARILWRSASARLDNKDAAAALPELEEAVALAEKFLPPEHPYLKEYRETLAKCREAIAK